MLCEEENVETNPTCFLILTDSCNKSNFDAALNDQSTIELSQKYLEFQNPVRNGHLGKTGKLWLSVTDQFKLILILIYPVKIHKRKLFHYCNGEMAILLFAYDVHKHSCYLTWFEAFVTNLELTHPGAMDFTDNGALGCACLLIPDSLCAVDKTMEKSMQREVEDSLEFSRSMELINAGVKQHLIEIVIMKRCK